MFFRRQSFVRGHLLHVAVICCFSMSVSIPISTQLQEDACLVSGLLVAQDTRSEVRVTYKDSLPESSQQSISLPNEHLPSICGTHFSRCNMILMNNSALPRAVLVLPVERGVALISLLYDTTNGTVQLESYHVLELTSAQTGNTMCQITTLYDFSDATMGGVPGVIGLCLNEVNIRRMSVTIDFSDLSRSSLSRLTYDVPITLYSPRNLSNFVSIMNNLPLCWAGLLSTLTYYFEESSFGLFDIISQENYPEEYTVYYSNGQKFVCSLPRQLIQIAEQNLIMYCENMTAEVDMCEFSGSSVRNVKFYNESNGGVPYYCSSDMSSYVMVSGETVTFNSTINRTLPLMSNESVFFGDCITGGDGILFAVTTTIGNVYLLDLQQEDGVVLKVRNQPIFAQHQVYNESILYTNGSSTVLYNTSCRTDPHRIVIDHPYHLALHTLGEGTQSCSCSRQIVQGSTTETGPENEPSDKNIIIVVVLLLIFVITMIVVLAFVIKFVVKVYDACRRSTENYRRRPLRSSKKTNSQNSTNTEMETSFTDPTSSKGRVEEKGQRSGVETGEGGGEGGQEKAEKAAVVEDVSTQPSSSVLPNQPESATVSLSLAEPIDRNVTSCAGTVDQPEQLQVQSDSGTGTYCQEYSWKNSDKRSVVLASSQQNPYPSGITVSQPGARATNERAASDENLTQSPCNDESNSTRTSNSFNSSLGNSGNHPAPTTTPVECSDNR